MINAYLLNHPQHVEHVLQTNQQNYRKPLDSGRMKSLFGDERFIGERELWGRQKKLAQPLLRPRNLDLLSEQTLRVVSEHLRGWSEKLQTSSEFNLSEDMSALATNIIVQTFFAASHGRYKDRLYCGLQRIGDVGESHDWDVESLATELPLNENTAYKAAVSDIQHIVADIIDARRKDNAPATDLLGILLNGIEPDDDSAVNDARLQSEIITLILEGFKSTAGLLVWAIYFLSEHAHVLECVRNEADLILQGRNPTRADTREMEYTKRVVQEVARLQPTVSWFSRTAVEDDVIGGELIKAGTTVLICQNVLHKLPAEWRDPDRFDPDRFLPEQIAGRSKFSYLPFGAGPSVSVGSSLTMTEMQLVLPLVYRKFDITVTPQVESEPRDILAFGPTHDLLARVKGRMLH